MEKEIFKAYETMEPDALAKERMLANILSLASEQQGTEMETIRKRKGMDMEKKKAKRKLQIAAALAAVLIIPAVGAYATNLFGLRSMNVGKVAIQEPVCLEGVTGEGPAPEMEEREVDAISLQGFSGSPEAMACAEWTTFYENYDKDGSILSEIGNGPTGLDEKYTEAYNCYTQEMADKVDEICEKYQLSALTGLEVADTYEQLCSRAGIGDVCGGLSEGVRNSATGGYFYEDGTLHFEGMAVVDGLNECVAEYQFCRSVKGSFCSYILNVENIDDYEQWEYTTANGETALLANSDSKALIIVDKEESFIVVNVLGDILADAFDISNEALEMLADMFDFSAVR